MADSVADPGQVPGKKGKTTLLLWLALCLAGAAAGYMAVYRDLVPFLTKSHAASGEGNAEKRAKPAVVSFVELPPVMISISGAPEIRHLRFRAQLEVEPGQEAAVKHLVPRVMDVLNGYLRALELEDLEDSMALMRLRAQMLRRVQMIVGPENVRDLLVMEFVLN